MLKTLTAVRLIAVLIVNTALSACMHTVPVRPPLTFDDELFASEGVRCADITAHEEGETPDCNAIVDAFERGRTRVAAIYEAARNIRMSAFQFYRPKRYWTDPSGVPFINTLPEAVGVGGTWGVTWGIPPELIEIAYAWPDVIEHEATHALLLKLDPERKRRPEDRQASRPASQQAFEYFREITCHGTPDDPFGVPGQTASCIRAYRP